MKKLLSAICISLFSMTAAYADSIPYPNSGVENHALYTFTATATGNLSAYFYVTGARASFDETVGLLVNGTDTGITGLDNHASNNGDQLDFGNVHAGDILTFYLSVVDTHDIYYSNKALNADGANHVYSTSFTGDPAYPAIPTGTYIGFEDLAAASSDFNYNDDAFVFTNTSTITSAVPEPSTWVMLILGFIGIGSLMHQRRLPDSRATMNA